MSDILKQLEKIQADPELAKKFMVDPEGTLKAQGLKTAGLKVSRTTNIKDVQGGVVVDKATLKGLQAGKLPAGGGTLAATVCGSVGYVVCGSVGD